MNSPKLSNDARTGFYFVGLYLVIITVLVFLMLILKNGGGFLIFIGFITTFPFLPLILGLLLLITGNEELLLIPVNISSLYGMIIGGSMNAFVLFLLGYFGSKLFRKRNSS
jgi:hypothetical protein